MNTCGKDVFIGGGLVRVKCALNAGHEGPCGLPLPVPALPSPFISGAWMPQDVSRLLDALEALVDAQTVLAVQSLAGHSVPTGSAAERVRARYQAVAPETTAAILQEVTKKDKGT